jgi:hypothetical protein
MDMEMIENLLVSCMKKCYQTPLCTKTVFAIFTKLQQYLGNRSEQNIDRHFSIAQNEVIEFMGKGKAFSVLHPMMLETTS